MKTFELQPTYENILDAFEKDILNRNVDILGFADLLNSIDSSCSIALDARWGAGKTFFIKQVKLVLDAFNEHIENPHSDDNERVKRAWHTIKEANKPELQPQVSVYYDAWINDNDEDPILSLVYSILQSVSTDFTFTQRPGFWDIAAAITEAITGHSAIAIREAIQSVNPLEQIRSVKSLQEQIAEFLESLLAERGNRIVVFVDELDRCNPAFAIKLLERIKHYFSNSRITFVFSVNIAELQHVVRNHYGSGFNASRYLDRFFDLRIDLPPANTSLFYQDIGLENGSWVYETVCKAVIDRYQFTLREIAKFYRMARAAAYIPTHHSKAYDFCFSEEKSIRFCLMFLVPIMIGLKICDYSRYEAFVTGKDGSPLFEVLANLENNISILNDLLSDKETFCDAGQAQQGKVVKLEDKLNAVYIELFVRRQEAYSQGAHIGQLTFRASTKETLLRAVSTLSKYADFEV